MVCVCVCVCVNDPARHFSNRYVTSRQINLKNNKNNLKQECQLSRVSQPENNC